MNIIKLRDYLYLQYYPDSLLNVKVDKYIAL